ncbi:hypothetical protein LXL04_001435 [Taraxacum kok-saghyz]
MDSSSSYCIKVESSKINPPRPTPPSNVERRHVVDIDGISIVHSSIIILNSRSANNELFSPEHDEEGGWGTKIKEYDQSGVVQKMGSLAYLTWEELGVASLGKDGGKSLLTGVSGYAKPGVGPSGCGKSTLLDSLAGWLASNTRHTGRVLINGRKQRLTYGTLDANIHPLMRKDKPQNGADYSISLNFRTIFGYKS